MDESEGLIIPAVTKFINEAFFAFECQICMAIKDKVVLECGHMMCRDCIVSLDDHVKQLRGVATKRCPFCATLLKLPLPLTELPVMTEYSQLAEHVVVLKEMWPYCQSVETVRSNQESDELAELRRELISAFSTGSFNDFIDKNRSSSLCGSAEAMLSSRKFFLDAIQEALELVMHGVVTSTSVVRLRSVAAMRLRLSQFKMLCCLMHPGCQMSGDDETSLVIFNTSTPTSIPSTPVPEQIVRAEGGQCQHFISQPEGRITTRAVSSHSHIDRDLFLDAAVPSVPEAIARVISPQRLNTNVATPGSFVYIIGAEKYGRVTRGFNGGGWCTVNLNDGSSVKARPSGMVVMGGDPLSQLSRPVLNASVFVISASRDGVVIEELRGGRKVVAFDDGTNVCVGLSDLVVVASDEPSEREGAAGIALWIVVAHKGTVDRISELAFMVRWEGREEEEEDYCWFHYCDIKGFEALGAYLETQTELEGVEAAWDAWVANQARRNTPEVRERVECRLLTEEEGGVKRRRPAGYWSEDICRREALKYASRSQFKRRCPGGYSATNKNNWTGELCRHMGRSRRGSGDAAEQSEDLSVELQVEACRSGTSRSSARAEYSRKPHGHWQNKGNCAAEALKYASHRGFNRGCKGACDAAKKNHWLEEICRHMSEPSQSRHSDDRPTTRGGAVEDVLAVDLSVEEDNNASIQADVNGSTLWRSRSVLGKSVFVAAAARYGTVTKEYGLGSRIVTFDDGSTTRVRPDGITVVPASSSSTLPVVSGRSNEWGCVGCTYLNTNPGGSKCEVCGSARKYPTRTRSFGSNPSSFGVTSTTGPTSTGIVTPTSSRSRSSVNAGVSATRRNVSVSEDGRKPTGYWNDKERCRKEASKCSSRRDFRVSCKGAYTAADRNNWVDEFGANMGS